MESVIEDKDMVKDLGIIVDNELRYRTQMDNAINKAIRGLMRVPEIFQLKMSILVIRYQDSRW